MLYVAIVVVLLHILHAARCYRIQSNHDAMMYLNRFGYINDEDMTDNSDMPMSSMKPMLMQFQSMCSLNQTGVLDAETMSKMNAPRCGNLDMNLTEHHLMFLNELPGERRVHPDRYRRFTINDHRFVWKKRELTYKLGMFSEKMGAHVTRDVAMREIHNAFQMWSDVTNLDFIHRPTDSKVDIELSFTMRYHLQDNFPFDGPGKTLAHAFPPGEGVLGDVHFEDEEPWSVGSPKGVNVLFVAVHEIGHALGLSHSKAKGAIMQPVYGGYSPKLQLHQDDIDGIRSLYGVRDRRKQPTIGKDVDTSSNTVLIENKPKSTPRPYQPPRYTTTAKLFSTMKPVLQSGKEQSRPDLCVNPKLDAITALKDGTIYAFQGDYVFQIDSKGRGVVGGGPHRIGAIFDGLEGNIDAAMTRKSGKTYFFKGSNYWRFDGRKMDTGYPKKLTIHFRGIPDHIDSAFQWLNAMYFTKGDKIWRFDPASRPFVSEKYPVPLERWDLRPQVPRLDASFMAPNGHIYFFYDEMYWRFDEKTFTVDRNQDPPYPRRSKEFWFGCYGQSSVDYRNIRDPFLRSDTMEYQGYLEEYSDY